MAIGKGKHPVKTEMEKLTLSDLTCREALKELSLAIMVGRDEDTSKTNDIQMGWICTESGNIFQRVPDDIASEAKDDASKRYAVLQGQ